MDVKVSVGDVLEFPADVLISTANPWLNMSGGVNGAICERCPEIQDELHQWLEENYKTSVPAGSVVTTSASSLPFLNIVHAVAIDPFYDSTLEIVSKTLLAAFGQVVELEANVVSMPTLATGVGPLDVDDFAFAFRKSVLDRFDSVATTIVVRAEENARLIRGALNVS